MFEVHTLLIDKEYVEVKDKNGKKLVVFIQETKLGPAQSEGYQTAMKRRW